MTRVRRSSHRGSLTFITEGWKVLCRQARLHTQRPGEDAGRSIPPQPGLDTYVFFGSELKSIVAALAASVSSGVFVASQRRARSEVILHMQPDTSDESTEFEEDDLMSGLPKEHPTTLEAFREGSP